MNKEETYIHLSFVRTLVARGILSLHAILRQAARDNPSSIACVAPVAECGMKACAASPIFTIRPPGEAHTGSGSLKVILKSTTESGGV